MGCVAHCLDLMMEDLAKIPAFKALIDTCVRIAKFVKSHGLVAKAFKRIIGRDCLTLKLFPSTRFAYAHLTIVRCLKNKGNLQQLIDDDQWDAATRSISSTLVERFKSDVEETDWRALTGLHELLGPVDSAIHHMEECGARASHVYMIASALIMHVAAWKAKPSVVRCFAEEVRGRVTLLIISQPYLIENA